MNKPVSKTLLVILAIVVVAVIGFFVYNHHPVTTTQTPSSDTDTANTPNAQWPSVKVKDETITDKSSYYSIDATYPVTSDPVINGYFKKFVDDAVTEFKDDSSWAKDDPSSAEASALSLSITYKEQKNAHVDNYTFATTTYTGGAHGLESTKTFAFTATGQLVSLSTLFSNGNDGLKTIAPYVKAQLQKSLPSTDQQFVDDGTKPVVTNYNVFTVQDDSITFIFDPYQVAPYSDGQQKVTVPLSVFKSIADADIFTQ